MLVEGPPSIFGARLEKALGPMVAIGAIALEHLALEVKQKKILLLSHNAFKFTHSKLLATEL